MQLTRPMPRFWTFVTERPGMPLWDDLCSPAAKAKRAAHKAQRERIMADARAKGWRHWRGGFWAALSRKLKAIGYEDAAWLLEELRLERAQEAKWAGEATKAELKMLADEARRDDET